MACLKREKLKYYRTLTRQSISNYRKMKQKKATTEISIVA